MRLRTMVLASTLACLTSLSGALPVHAEWIRAAGVTTETMGASRVVARAGLTHDLATLGVDPLEARARVAALSDREVMEVARRLEDQPAGQGFVGAVVGVVAVSAAVLFFTDLLGFTDVFSFVDPIPSAPGSPAGSANGR